MKILMVCLGNICRSPLAEGILQHKCNQLNLPWEVDSAGTIGFHSGEPPHPLSQKVAQLHGIDISRQRSRPFVEADVDRFDKMYAMAGDVLQEMKQIAGPRFDLGKTELLLNVLHPGSNKDVPDPWYSDEARYHEVYQMLDEACEAIIHQLAGNITGKLTRK